MGKTLGAIFKSIMGPVTGLITGGGSGLVQGLGNLATAYIGGPVASALQIGSAIVNSLQSTPRPDTASTAIKTARPERVSQYGSGRLYGAYALYETAEDGTAIDVFAVHDGELTEVLQYYLNDDQVTLSSNIVQTGTDGRYGGGKLSLYTTAGAETETAFAAVVAKLPGIWGTDHRGDGVVSMALLCAPVKSKVFLETYPNGVPVPSMAAKWLKCPDPYAADPTDDTAWTWTENPIRQLLHYKLVREGVDYATKIAPTIAYWRAAADICEEAVSLKAGGSEDRWRSWVGHKHTDPHGGVTAALLATCDGWIAPRSDGAIVVYAGKYYTPTVSIGPDEIVAFEWSGVGVDDDQAVNEIICSYVSAEHDYTTPETDAWRDEADITARGEVLSETLEMQVPSWGQVRRLAKRRMARQNALYRGTVTTNTAGRIMRGQRYINLELIEAGATFYDGPVEVTAITRNMATGGVTFSWVAADPDIDDWDPNTEEGNSAADGDRVVLDPLTAPTIYAAVLIDGPRIELDVIGPDRTDLTWFVHWRVAGETEWGSNLEYSDADPGSDVVLITDILNPTGDIEVQVAYLVGDGRFSPWSDTETVVVDEIILDGGDIGDPS